MKYILSFLLIGWYILAVFVVAELKNENKNLTNTIQNLNSQMQDYQLSTDQKGITIYREGKFVDFVAWDSSNISKIILKDNE